MRRTWALLAGALIVGLIVAGPALAKPAPKMHTEIYMSTLVPLNGSGVHAKAQLMVRGDRVRVLVNASRVASYTTHTIAIQGFSGDATKAIVPTASPDGTITAALGETFYGAPMLSLVDSAGVSPSSNASGTLHFMRWFTGQSALRPYGLRTIVVYGGFVNGVYDATLPVACGVIKPINKWARVADGAAARAKAHARAKALAKAKALARAKAKAHAKAHARAKAHAKALAHARAHGKATAHAKAHARARARAKARGRK